MKGDLSFVPFGYLEGGRDMARVAMGADDGEHFAVTDDVEDAVSVLSRIDDDDFVVVTDDPGVGRVLVLRCAVCGNPLYPRFHGSNHGISPG
jgi:hypothetical protein